MKRAERRAVWQRHIDAWRASGLTLSAYCAGERLSRESMRRWRRRFASEPIRNNKLRTPSPGIPSGLVPIHVRAAASARPLSTSGLIEIRLPRGRSIVIDALVDAAGLARLISVVERAP